MEHDGLDRHAYYLSKDQILKAAEYMRLTEASQVVTTTVIKISILFLLLRITKLTITKWMARFIYVLITSLTIINIISFVALFVGCNPTKGGQCTSNKKTLELAYTQAGNLHCLAEERARITHDT